MFLLFKFRTKFVPDLNRYRFGTRQLKRNPFWVLDSFLFLYIEVFNFKLWDDHLHSLLITKKLFSLLRFDFKRGHSKPLGFRSSFDFFSMLFCKTWNKNAAHSKSLQFLFVRPSFLACNLYSLLLFGDLFLNWFLLPLILIFFNENLFWFSFFSHKRSPKKRLGDSIESQTRLFRLLVSPFFIKKCLFYKEVYKKLVFWSFFLERTDWLNTKISRKTHHDKNEIKKKLHEEQNKLLLMFWIYGLQIKIWNTR